jgi:hypothetical protein
MTLDLQMQFLIDSLSYLLTIYSLTVERMKRAQSAQETILASMIEDKPTVA